MDNVILSKVRKLNWVLQEAPKGSFSFNDLCEILSELTDSDVYLTNVRGKVLGRHFILKEDNSLIVEEKNDNEYIPLESNETLLKILETKVDFDEKEVKALFADADLSNGMNLAAIPVLGGGERWGTMLLLRFGNEFTPSDIALAEIGATTVGIEIQRKKTIEAEEEERSADIVKMAIGTLSYSETEAVKKIFKELEGKEGILVASRIADKSKITRSVIVNALRKLESAGVIESRSLGMKGTHIKIINDKLMEYL